MAVFSIIQESQLEGAKRLDAEYYQPEYLARQSVLSKDSSQPLVSLTDKIDVGFVSSMASHFQDEGVPLLRTQNVQEFYVDLSDVIFIDEGFHKKLKKSILKPGYVLIARSGSIGAAAVVPKDIGDANSADIILIKTKLELLPEYLAAFLNSKYGQFQIERASSGGLQGHVNLFSLEQLSIANVSQTEQEKVRDIVQSGYIELEHSKSLYAQAESLLLEELGLKGFKADEDLYSVVNFSDIKSVNRMDAEYFQPKHERLITKLKVQKARPLTDVLENVPAKFNPLTQSDKAFKYVELSNIDGSIGIINGYTETSGREAPGRAKRVLKKDDIIVSTVEGSLDKVALVHKEQEGFLASTGFFQFRSKDLLPEVLLVIAKSFIFHNQLEQRCAGTILTAVPKDSIRDILVPILPTVTQEKISKLVRESHAARKKAKELLEEAKRTVEELIESRAK